MGVYAWACKRPSLCVQLFRADLISAMKLPDSMPLESGSFFTIKEPWRTEWEVGVQVNGYMLSWVYCARAPECGCDSWDGGVLGG